MIWTQAFKTNTRQESNNMTHKDIEQLKRLLTEEITRYKGVFPIWVENDDIKLRKDLINIIGVMTE